MLKKSKRGGLNSFSRDWTKSLSRPSEPLRGSPRFSPELAMTAPLLFSSGEAHLLWSLFLFWRNLANLRASLCIPFLRTRPCIAGHAKELGQLEREIRLADPNLRAGRHPDNR